MTTSSSKKPERKTFTDFARANTRFVIEPIVTLLARLGISPDFITVLGLVAHVLFAWLIVNEYLLLAGIAVAILSPLDALDGALSRKLGRKQGGFGAFFDSTLDRIAEIVLFGSLVFYFMQSSLAQSQWLVLLTYLALSGSLMVSYTRSRAETLGYSCKVGIFSRVERYICIIVFLLLTRPDWLVIVLAIGTWVTVAQRVAHVWRQAQRAP